MDLRQFWQNAEPRETGGSCDAQRRVIEVSRDPWAPSQRGSHGGTARERVTCRKQLRICFCPHVHSAGMCVCTTAGSARGGGS
jgi:hypothetical protein